MKIYTKTGDKGQSALWGGVRVSKASKRMIAYGTVDELNSWLGYVLALELDAEIATKLRTIQEDLLVIGSDLATPEQTERKIKQLRIATESISRLEAEIDSLTVSLPLLKTFIVPSGSLRGAALHYARTICRRAEREVVSLISEEHINDNVLIYLNRLSDWLFTAARYQNKRDGQAESVWKI